MAVLAFSVSVSAASGVINRRGVAMSSTAATRAGRGDKMKILSASAIASARSCVTIKCRHMRLVDQPREQIAQFERERGVERHQRFVEQQ